MITQKEVIDLKRRAANAGIKTAVVDDILKSWGEDQGTRIILSALEAKANDPEAGRRFREMVHESMTTKQYSRIKVAHDKMRTALDAFKAEQKAGESPPAPSILDGLYGRDTASKQARSTALDGLFKTKGK